MIRPRTDAGREGLAALRADPARSLVALDYDGTLAPVVARPEGAVPAPGALEVLEALAARVPLALLTGRPVAIVLALSGFGDLPGLQVLGQYGAEDWTGGVLTAVPPEVGLEVAREAVGQLRRARGVTVEDKGLSLVVHARQADDPRAALADLAGPLALIARDTGLELHSGRLVWELRPPGLNKGAALHRVAAGARAVLWAGDDVGDTPAYEAVDALRAAGVPGLTVFSDSDEGPAALRDRADVVVRGPAGVVALLADLLP